MSVGGREAELKKKWIMGTSYLYVLLPTVLFLLGWVKIWIAAPACLFLLWCFIKALEEETDLYLPVWNRENIMRGVIMLLVILVWVYFSGIGNFAWQNRDHAARNALYEILAANEWPVVKDVVCEEGTQTRGLIYYIGYWLPAAAAGKLFGVAAGYFFQYIWAVLGIFLCAVFINSFLRKWAVWHVVLFILFSGLDAGGYILAGNFSWVLSFGHLERWNDYQFSSFTTQLYWVFNQAVYAWILFAQIMMQKNNRRILCIWILGMITCTFPFVGMLPFVVYVICRNGKSASTDLSGKRAGLLNGLLSFENLFGGVIGVICLLYLTGNLSAQKRTVPVAELSHIQNTEGFVFYLGMYVLFILLEIGVYYIYLHRHYKRNWLFYISLVSLLVCPLIKVGSGGDFCMRASIPSLLVLYYMVAESLQKDLEQRNIRCLILILILAVGSITAVHEMGRSAGNTIWRYQQHHEVVNQVFSEERILRGDNFSGKTDGNPFFMYLAK